MKFGIDRNYKLLYKNELLIEYFPESEKNLCYKKQLNTKNKKNVHMIRELL